MLHHEGRGEGKQNAEKKRTKETEEGKKVLKICISKLSILSIRLHETLLLLDCYHQSWWAGLIHLSWGLPGLGLLNPGFLGKRDILGQIMFCCGGLPYTS